MTRLTNRFANDKMFVNFGEYNSESISKNLSRWSQEG